MKRETKTGSKTNEGTSGLEVLTSDKKTVVRILQLVDVRLETFDVRLLTHIRAKLALGVIHHVTSLFSGLINKRHYRMLCLSAL